MSVTYLLPSCNPDLWPKQAENLENLCLPGDEVVVNTKQGMIPAMQEAFKTSKGEIIRNCADDDDYNLPGSIRAVEIMDADPSIDVLVTGGYKSHRQWKDKAVCVPRGANYGSTPETVAWYGACGSGLFIRTDAVRKYSLLDYDGRLIDNFIVLQAITSGAKVRFCRLDTYRHYMSLSDMTEDQYAAFQQEKREMREQFGIAGVGHRPHQQPPVWDGAFA